MIGTHSVPMIVDEFLKEQVKVEGEGEPLRALATHKANRRVEDVFPIARPLEEKRSILLMPELLGHHARAPVVIRALQARETDSPLILSNG